jgi:hypothetical protein
MLLSCWGNKILRFSGFSRGQTQHTAAVMSRIRSDMVD